jgi:hypothetical protein
MGIKSRLPKMEVEMKTGTGKKVSQTMRIVCAYCGRCMGEKEGNGVEGDSHGICQECFGKRMNDRKEVKDDRK